MEEYRLSRNDYYLYICLVGSLRSTCKRAKNACVLVDGDTNRLVSVGYNGTPPGAPHCTDNECLMHEGHCIATIHAEINAISHIRGRFDNLIAYCTSQPCASCYKALVAVNVKEIYFIRRYESEERDKLITLYGVPLYKKFDPEIQGWKKIGNLLGYSFDEQEMTS